MSAASGLLALTLQDGPASPNGRGGPLHRRVLIYRFRPTAVPDSPEFVVPPRCGPNAQRPRRALKLGGPDAPSKIQLQTTAQAKAKDRIE